VYNTSIVLSVVFGLLIMLERWLFDRRV